MNMKILTNKIALLILAFGISLNTVSQTGKLIKADKNFRSFNYQNAIKHYTDMATSGYRATTKVHVNTRLGDSYRLINDPVNAEIWYQKAVNSDKCEAKTYYYYAQVLRNNKKYDEVSVWLKKYLDSNPEDQAAVKELAEFNGYSELLADSNLIAIEFMENINTKMSDYSPAYYKDKIIFVSSRDTISARRSSWTDEPFYSLYECKIDSNHQLVFYKRLFGEVNSRYHEGPVSYHNKSEVLYFTRNNYFEKKKGKSKDNTNFLKIYQAIYKEGKWQDIKELPFNNDEYSCAHPAISPDGSRLYFISNMPGGLGGTDLYYCEKQDSGWSKPKNAGEPLNTAGDELFPTYSQNGILYFASTGHPGLGGMDIFSFSEGEIKNLGYPINTSFDDFGLTTQNDERGFFSSNRNGGYNNDDIYYFKINQPPTARDDELFVEIFDDDYDIDTMFINVLPNDSDPNMDIDFSSVRIISQSNKNSFSLVDSIGTIYYLPEKGFKGIDTLQYVVFDHTNLSDTANLYINVVVKEPNFSLYCIIKDNKTQEVLSNVKIILTDLITGKEETINTPATGDFFRELEGRKLNDSLSYEIKLKKKGYLAKSFFYNQTLYRPGQYNMNEDMIVDLDKIEVGMDLSKFIDAETIFFDLGKAEIRSDAALILDKFVKALLDNPEMVIELRAHTDSRGSASSNMSLSDRRAKASAKYIKERLPNPERISGKGYGESQILNKCTDGVPCSKEEHQLNRRTEFRIVKVN